MRADLIRRGARVGVPDGGALDAPVAHCLVRRNLHHPGSDCAGDPSHQQQETTARAYLAAPANRDKVELPWCYRCLDESPLADVARRVNQVGIVAQTLEALARFLPWLEASDLATRAAGLRGTLYLAHLHRVDVTYAWAGGDHDPARAFIAAVLDQAWAEANKSVAQARASWPAERELVAPARRVIEAWNAISTDEALDAAVAAALAPVAQLGSGSPVFVVPAGLVARDRRWRSLGPAVAGAELDTRVAIVNAGVSGDLPDQATLDEMVTAADAALS